MGRVSRLQRSVSSIPSVSTMNVGPLVRMQHPALQPYIHICSGRGKAGIARRGLEKMMRRRAYNRREAYHEAMSQNSLDSRAYGYSSDLMRRDRSTSQEAVEHGEDFHCDTQAPTPEAHAFQNGYCRYFCTRGFSSFVSISFGWLLVSHDRMLLISK